MQSPSGSTAGGSLMLTLSVMLSECQSASLNLSLCFWCEQNKVFPSDHSGVFYMCKSLELKGAATFSDDGGEERTFSEWSMALR